MPVIFQRTVKQAGNRNIVKRYEKLALAAVQQSQRAFLPQIDAPHSLTETVATIERDYSHITLLAGSLDDDTPKLSKIELPLNETNATTAVVAFIGPEGGMTDEEIEFLRQHNAQPVQLTRTVLRIETAAITFAALFCTQK
jgi:16S rRNA (uracil1498-N3)-methyltransferase